MGINEYVNVGIRMKMQREKKGYSQNEIASLLGIPRATYSSYECGRREPPIEVVKKVATIFGVELDGLVGIDHKDNTKKHSKIQKKFYLSEEAVDQLHLLKKQGGYPSISQVVESMLLQESVDQEEKIAQAVREELEKNYLSKRKIKSILEENERNLSIILDYINTISFRDDIRTCIPYKDSPSEFVEESRELDRERIAALKHKKDKNAFERDGLL